MDSSAEEIFYDTQIQEEGNENANQNQKDDRHIYFELDKHPCSSSSDEDGELSHADKYKTAKPDLGNYTGLSLEKSKISVADRAKIFDKISDHNVDRSALRNKQGPQVNSTTKMAQNSDNQYDKLWQGQTHTGDKHDVYAMAEPVPFPAMRDKTKSLPASSKEPLLPPSDLSPSTSTGQEQESVGIYCLASDIPSDSSTKKKKDPKNKSLFYMSTPVPIMSPSPSIESLKVSGNRGCQQGTGAAVPVDFIHPVPEAKKSEDSEYNRLYFKSTEKHVTPSMRQRLKEKGYDTMSSIKSGASRKSSRSNQLSLDDSDVSDDDDTSFDWGSEFDDFSYQESIDDLFQKDGHLVQEDEDYGIPEKPLPPKPVKGKFGYQDLLPKPLRPTNQTDQHDSVDLTSSAVCLPVNINLTKHPPPRLPTEPGGLSDEQKKRRCVIDLIISSEKSYLDSLERILKQYEKGILEAIPNPKARVRVVFTVVREIISHHRMFQIELSEAVTAWDQEEKIGDIFTASFSKTMVVNAYSIFVNNFSAAMEEIRTAQRNKQSFDEFLRNREKSNSDRLSIFGLMVKPVQRFPQFIMCLQDLIKYLPSDHHDRRALQLALTELENVTHMLNERKRCSEQRFQALQTIHQLIRQKAKHMLTGWNLDMNTSRRLIRYDSVEQVLGEFEQMKCKDRRLILMNDLVICVKVIEKEQSGFQVERLGLRWMAKLKDLELKDTAITPDMQSVIKKEPGKIHIISSQLERQGGEKLEEDPFHLYADLSEMLHDYTVLGQVTAMVSTLKRNYSGQGLTEELVHEISRDLQRMIQIKDEQLRLVNSCSLVLVDHSRSDKPHYVLQTQTAAIKQDWSIDFLMAKLAQDKSNSPGWDRTHATDDLELDAMPAHFMKHLPVDVPRNYTKIKCAVSVFLTPEKSPSGLGVQHLWVCSSTESRGQVSILSIHNSKPSLTESFKASDCDIISVELVPGCGEATVPNNHLFVEDTVWMTTANKEIIVFPTSSSSGVRRDPLSIIHLVATVISIRFVDERVFCGLDNGSLLVYSRQCDGAWDITNPSVLTFGSCSVRIHFVWEEDLWVSCGNHLFVVEIDSLENKKEELLHADHETSIDHVTRAGMGIWVSFINSSFIKLFHVETLENLQEMSIGHFLQRKTAEKLWILNPIKEEDMQVTCLATSKGLLWIGTNLGVVLTLTLPRLSDGVPLYRGRPSVSLHAHRGPVKFIIPLVCASNTTELKRSSTLVSTLRSRPSRRNLERERLEVMEEERFSLGKDILEEIDEMGTSGSLQSGTISDNAAVYNGNGAEDTNISVFQDENSNEKEPEYQNISEVLTSKSQIAEEMKEGEDELTNSFDDDVVLRKRNTEGFASTRSRRESNLSFRSELANRIMVQSQRLSGSCGDLSINQPQEVEMLYEDLLEDDSTLMNKMTLPKGAAGTPLAAGMRHTLGHFRSSDISKFPSSSQSQAKKSQKQKKNTPTLSQSVCELSKEEKSPKSQSNSSVQMNPVISPFASSTFSLSPGSEGRKIPSLTPRMSNAGYMTSLKRADTMRGTVRKTGGNNAVVVLSGGDGYKDLNSSRNQSRNDDASVMLWIYKF